MLMLTVLAALAIHSAEWEHVLFYCKRKDPVGEFSLAYDRRGAVIKDVKVVDRGSPRLPPDTRTKWRGKVDGEGVTFHYRSMENGFWTSGEMRLQPVTGRAGHFALTWSSTMGGIGGHMPMGSPEETADCTAEGMASF
jgi:hypothetical protein